VTYVIALSIAFQTAAAVMAFRLIAVTGRKTAWVLISLALALMAVRRVIPLYHMIFGKVSVPPDLLFESIGLILSMAMALGVAMIAPIFRERIQSELSARESQERLLTILDSLDAIVYVADMKTYEIIHINRYARDLFGKLEGKICWQTLQRGQRGPCVFCTNDRIVDAAGNPTVPYKWEYRNTRTGRWFYVIDRAVGWVDGRIVRLEIATDVTERRKAEDEIRNLNEQLESRVKERTSLLERKTEELERANERLKEIDRLKSAFLASMSHELRTPLNSIIGFSTVLLNEWVGPANAEQKQNLASILRSGRHLLNMINDVLDVTQIEAGTIKPVIEEFDLYDLLTEAESEVAAAMRERGLELRRELLRQRMRTDRQRFLQCVLNILNNAVKFTDMGSVTLEARIVSFPGETPGEEMVEIAVTDTGIGIGEEDRSRIFHPFSRIVTPQRTIVSGTGLGLFLSRKIAREILKGDIFVSSEYGKGSRFTLRIPVRLP
jgi:signal transduction histidine kinase